LVGFTITLSLLPPQALPQIMPQIGLSAMEHTVRGSSTAVHSGSTTPAYIRNCGNTLPMLDIGSCLPSFFIGSVLDSSIASAVEGKVDNKDAVAKFLAGDNNGSLSR
jgi:hypothetical protein